MSSALAKGINRADLLRALLRAGEESLCVTAEMTGFISPVRRKVTLKIPSMPAAAALKTTRVKPRPKPQLGKQANFYRLIERRASGLLPEPGGQALSKPRWYQTTPSLNPDEIKPLPVQPPAKEPLVAWAKIWPVLRSQLSEVRRARQPDIPKIVKILAEGNLLHSIPRKPRQRWVATVQLLVDRPERTALFNLDFNRLLEQLKQLRGETGLEIQTIAHHPGGRVRVMVNGKPQMRDWHVPEAGTTVFILSDLGVLDESGLALRAWLHVGRQLRLAGCRPVAFAPLPTRYLTAALITLFECISWDRGSSLRPVTYVPPRDEAESTPMQQDAVAGAKHLLAWLSPAVRVEPALLRAVRHHLSVQAADAGTEAAAWHHDDVARSPIGFHFQPMALEAYRRRFSRLAQEHPQLAQTIAATILAYHRHLFPTQRYEELLILAQLLGNQLEGSDRREVQAARYHMRQLLKASLEQKEGIPSLPAFLRHHYFDRQHKAMLSDYDFLQAILGLRLSEQGGESEIPAGCDEQTVLAFFDRQATPARDYVLFQQGMQALQVGTRQRFDAGQDGFTEGSPLVEFRVVTPYLLNQSPGADGTARSVLLPLDDTQTQRLPLAEQARQHLHIAGEELTIERFAKPAWVVSIGRSHGALTAATQSAAGRHTWYWHSPVWQSERGMLPGYWHYLAPDASAHTPDWATASGRDGHGLYADADIAGMPQRFRWIEPASFQMGSPAGEGGRSDDETQHEVILTQGYWLADTACTQTLWQAVTGKNPSEYKEGNNPVENVNWKDIDQFLQRLNQRYPELRLRLPSEAEWENACRSGTTGAFNLDGALSLDKVNYRGTWDDYEKWGEGALQQTAAVKSYPPNRWGLYEMHGNVWEWCQDWYDDYPVGPVVDPQGAQSGTGRVLRGGSWIAFGRYCRSADRYHGDPAIRGIIGGSGGFRLARGLELSDRTGASQQPIGTPAPERGGHKRGLDGGTASEDSETGQVNQSKKQKKRLRSIMDSIKNRLKK